MAKQKISAEAADLDDEELLAFARRDLEAGRMEEALRKLKPLIAREEPVLEALPYVARIYAGLGLMMKARDCYKRFTQARPKAVMESFELGITYFEEGDGKEARALWEKVLDADPTHPPTLFYSGLLALREGRLPDARRNLDVLFKSAPTDNLYVTRGKELLNRIDQQAAGGALPA